jgi:hypothetical protein
VKDVRDPDDEGARAFASKVKLVGDAQDANAVQWVAKATAGKHDSVDGEWSSRWSGGLAKSEWIAGTATIKTVGNWIYILYTDRTGLYLLETRLQGKSRLVGRFMQLGDESESLPWVGEIVNFERIDGEWIHGRWDLRRKIADQ